MLKRFLDYVWSLRLFFFILLAIFLVAAQGQEFGSLEEILVWIITGGGAVALVAVIMAFLLENWPAWHNFPRWVKVGVPIFLAAFIGAFAEAVLELELLLFIPVAGRAFLLMLINYLFGQLGYMKLKATSYGSSARKIAASKL